METQREEAQSVPHVPARLETHAEQDRLHIRLFGGVDLTFKGLPLRPTRSRTETWLLAVLLLRTNRSVGRAWLAGVFWPESRETQALGNLRRSLSNLRQALGEESYRLVSPTPQTIAFDLADAFCDVTAFDNALARKDNASLHRAVELYRGPLLPDCDADWLLPERRAREQAFLAALETLSEQAIRGGDTLEAVRFLRQILRVDPFRETTHRALLEVLATVGDKAGMTLAYRQMRLLLHDELQSEPSAETKALYQRLQGSISAQVTITSLPPRLPESDSPPTPSPPLRIPFPVSELIGREAETQEVRSLLGTHRLVTLAGSGGIGKTRLALAVASRAALDFPSGIWFVDLSPVTDPAQVVSTLAHVLDVREREGQSLTDALLEHLLGRRLLLILDNAEHLQDSCAALTARLLETLPDLQVLATSRMPLGVAGEQVWRVPSLPCPDPSTPAVPDSLLDYAGPSLFVARALSASSTFVLTEKNAPAIVQICARLDGIPLALELAAARVGSLSAEQIAARLENAFRLLTMGPGTALPRHQTLRALVDWSYDLLQEPEKILLSRLSVFMGGWNLEDAESVCGFAPLALADVLDLLSGLLGKSLALAQEVDGTMRYRLLETLRQYGQERLSASGEIDQVGRRHRDYFVALAEAAEPHLNGPQKGRFLSELELQHDNLRQALAFCLKDEAGGEVGLRLGGALQQLWATRSYLSEGNERLAAALAHPGAQSPTKARANALFSRSLMVAMQGDHSSAKPLMEESLTIYRALGDEVGIARSLNQLGNVALLQGNYVSARSLYEDGLMLRREMGDRAGIANSLSNLGMAAFALGDYPTTRSLYEQSLIIRQELNDKNGIAISLINLGRAAIELGDHSSALPLIEESLAIYRALGDEVGIARSFNQLGNVALLQGDLPTARSLLKESLTRFRKLGYRQGFSESLEAFAFLAVKEERSERAVLLWSITAVLRDAIGSIWSPLNRALQEAALADARAKLGESAFAAAWAVGRAMTWEQAAAYALEE